MAAKDLPPERVLLVEGVDDKAVVQRLCERHPDVSVFDVSIKEGFANLRRSIPVEIKAPDRRAVGILADADDDPWGRWQSISDRLRRVGVRPPDRLAPGGLVLDGEPRTGVPRTGVWLMPDNTASGELEDFVVTLVPAGDPVWPRAERYVEDIPAIERRFRRRKTTRAKIHAWLATREDPRRMGTAIRAGDLDVDQALAAALVGWLRRLFG